MSIPAKSYRPRATPTVSMGSGESHTFSLDYDDGNVQKSDNVAWFPQNPNTVITQPNTSAPPNTVIGGFGAAGLGDIDPLACLPNPSAPNLTCAGGHRAAADVTEYIDGEMVSYCAGCGERIILPRVPGAVPILRLKRFIETMVTLATDGEADIDEGALLYEYTELKRAIETEADALSRLQSLLDIAERLIAAKLSAPPSE